LGNLDWGREGIEHLASWCVSDENRYDTDACKSARWT
jgi:hypothetical protein